MKLIPSASVFVAVTESGGNWPLIKGIKFWLDLGSKL